MGDLLPNDGTYFTPTEPEEQKTDRETEQAKNRVAEPVIKDVIKHFEETITLCESINSIDESVLLNPEEFMHVVAANKIAAKKLKAEKDYLEGLLKQ